MINGYNTEVRCGSVVFHVQTEDKGPGRRLIETLVFVDGRVLSARRTPYPGSDAADPNRSGLAELLRRQHRAIVGAVSRGELPCEEPPSPGPAAPPGKPTDHASSGALVHTGALDEALFAYLTSQAEREHLVLIVPDGTSPASGQRVHVSVKTVSSRGAAPIAGAEVTAELTTRAGGAGVLAKGKTDAGGSLELLLDLPVWGPGEAELRISAASLVGVAIIRFRL